MSGANVDLGFVGECEPWHVESRLFPSKIGGRPAWLDLQNIPNSTDLKCNNCETPMTFLGQVYAPYETDPNNFHRTLFIFVCRNADCATYLDNIKVFRSHLKRVNDFYPNDPPKEEPDSNFDVSQWVQLCNLCGCRADKHCGKCRKVYYCDRKHQELDWKAHKETCGVEGAASTKNAFLYPEFELCLESEQYQEETINEEKAMQDFENLQRDGKLGSMAETDESEFENVFKVKNDKQFEKFQNRIKNDADQVLRYERGGNPLFISSENKPSEIPNCEHCLGPRHFEFQIMPQILSTVKEDDLDWGVLLVYSCKSSCTTNNSYKNEYIVKQNISNNSD